MPKHVFGQYKSAPLHVKPVRATPPVLLLFLGTLIALAFLGPRVYSSIQAKIHPSSTSSATAPASGLPAPSGPPATAVASPPEFDEKAFVPRIEGKPETAPAYDQLRKVVNMPLVAGGWWLVAGGWWLVAGGWCALYA